MRRQGCATRDPTPILVTDPHCLAILAGVSLAPPARPPSGREPSPLDLLTDRRAIVDTTVPPVAFLVADAVASLHVAAIVAVALAVVLLLERLVRGAPVTNAVGGLLGTGLAVGIALRTGSVEGYFWPKVAQNGAYAVGFLVSVAVGRPAVGLLMRVLMRWPASWFARPHVRRVWSEITLAWVVLFTVRAVVYSVLILSGHAAWLGGAVLVLGWPAFAGVAFASYRYAPRRFAQLGEPDPRTDYDAEGHLLDGWQDAPART
ncbi:MAG: hypothetical protein QOI98_590 [Solirubrobacteraceae bacterium]|nr:hypothetical protein [Solirubrobacteraceae bacterium]